MILGVDGMHYLSGWKTLSTVTVKVAVYVVTYSVCALVCNNNNNNNNDRSFTAHTYIE